MDSACTEFRNYHRPFGPSKCSVYVSLPWIGSACQLIADKVTSSVACCYNAVKVRTIFTTRTAFCSIHKDVLLIFQQSNLIYKFQCCCEATYIGRTSQCLEVRVKRHVPRGLSDQTTSEYLQILDSTICEHLSVTNSCAANYNDKCFVVLYRVKTKTQ